MYLKMIFPTGAFKSKPSQQASDNQVWLLKDPCCASPPSRRDQGRHGGLPARPLHPGFKPSSVSRGTEMVSRSKLGRTTFWAHLEEMVADVSVETGVFQPCSSTDSLIYSDASHEECGGRSLSADASWQFMGWRGEKQVLQKPPEGREARLALCALPVSWAPATHNSPSLQTRSAFYVIGQKHTYATTPGTVRVACRDELGVPFLPLLWAKVFEHKRRLYPTW